MSTLSELRNQYVEAQNYMRGPQSPEQDAAAARLQSLTARLNKATAGLANRQTELRDAVESVDEADLVSGNFRTPREQAAYDAGYAAGQDASS